MSAPTMLITQSGVMTFPAWWWVMRVEDCAVVLRGSPDCTPVQVLVVAELDSQMDAGELFEVVNERIALRAKLFDVRESAPLVRSRAAGEP